MPWTCISPTHVSLLGFLLIPLVAAQQPPPWPESSQNYNSPMATALIVMIIVFFTVGFISVYLRHFIACIGFDSYGGLRRGGGDRAREPVNHGLDPTILNTFPTFLYSDVKIHRVGKTTPLECAVCISEFADNEILRLLPKCNHVFHPHCVDPWLSTHVTCPVCRANLETQLPYRNNNNNQRRPFENLTSDDEDSVRPQPSDHDHVIIRAEEEERASPSEEGNIVKSPTQQEIMKGLSMSESGRIIRLPRSHSTGHSLVEESDRFTLRLPEEVRNKLVNEINFTTAANAIVSPYHRPGCAQTPFKPDNRWRFSMSPPFISRPNSPKSVESPSVRTPNNNNYIPKSLFRSLKSPNKSPLHRVVSCSDIGERSSNKLWDNRTSEDLDLEDHHSHNHKQFG